MVLPGKYDTILGVTQRMSAIFAAFFLSAVTFCSDRAEAKHVIREAARIPAAIGVRNKGIPFDVEGTLAFTLAHSLRVYVIKDETGIAILHGKARNGPAKLLPGDRVRATGVIGWSKEINSHIAECMEIAVLGHNAEPEYELTSASALFEGFHDNRLVRLTGTVRDAFIDEVDPTCAFLVLQNGRDTIYSCFISQEPPKAWINSIVGAEISVKGLCSPDVISPRYCIGRCILFSGQDSVSVIRAAPSDPFDVPSLTLNRDDHAVAISGMDRRRVAGRVIAVWHGDRVLLRMPEGRIARVDLAERRPPSYGMCIDAVGNPETDLYRLNLSRAIWRTNGTDMAVEPPPKEITVRQLLYNDRGKPAIQIRHHGVAIRIKGIVRSLPSPGNSDGRLALECDRYIVPVDASACPLAFAGVEIGCVLEVAGTCLIETENWQPNAPFPHVEGFAIVVRTPDDIRIISRPPWWTPGRLLSVIGALLAALAGVFVWNRSLNRLAERRGRELTEETVARVTADLKVGERTRLAIELHDALSQNLTGAALEIETSDVLIDGNPTQAHRHLGIAAKTIKSCREELRNCLWDLRNDALGEKTMDEAIRRTLAPLMDGTGLAVRFNVPRECLSDDTAHALLRIIRELAQNAMRHGYAKTVKIAGSLETDRLLFSVQDDGCGFDPQNHPSVRQGHFGLQGIRERVNRFGGTKEIKSEAGKGTKVTIALNLGNGGRQT